PRRLERQGSPGRGSAYWRRPWRGPIAPASDTTRPSYIGSKANCYLCNLQAGAFRTPARAGKQWLTTRQTWSPTPQLLLIRPSRLPDSKRQDPWSYVLR